MEVDVVKVEVEVEVGMDDGLNDGKPLKELR